MDIADIILNISIFFIVLHGIFLCLYYYFIRHIKKGMDKFRRRNSMAVWQEMYWAYQEGDKKARLAYIFYTLAAISLMIGFGMFLVVRFK